MGACVWLRGGEWFDIQDKRDVTMDAGRDDGGIPSNDDNISFTKKMAGRSKDRTCSDGQPEV